MEWCQGTTSSTDPYGYEYRPTIDSVDSSDWPDEEILAESEVENEVTYEATEYSIQLTILELDSLRTRKPRDSIAYTVSPTAGVGAAYAGQSNR